MIFQQRFSFGEEELLTGPRRQYCSRICFRGFMLAQFAHLIFSASICFGVHFKVLAGHLCIVPIPGTLIFKTHGHG